MHFALPDSPQRWALMPSLMLMLCLTLLTQPALADWTLDNERSIVNFISIKNASIGEVHRFRSLAGSVSDDGAVRLVIDLDSVETLIPIRNQRMRELLFETVRFPSATLEASVPAALTQLEAGERRIARIAVALELHGSSRDYAVDVLVSRGADDSLEVALREPLILRAADFGLEAGVGILQEVAGLKSISTAVPVSAQLVFIPD